MAPWVRTCRHDVNTGSSELYGDPLALFLIGWRRPAVALGHHDGCWSIYGDFVTYVAHVHAEFITG